jgi:hypothetical protein
MRLRGLLVAPIVLAGCAGGGHAAHRIQGVYEARVTVRGAERTVWLDLTTGRFRVSSPAGHRRVVTVSDGHAAVTRFRGFTTEATGSPGFLVTTADPGVPALRDRLLGRGAPRGTTITGFHRVTAPSPQLFAVARVARPTMAIRQVPVGAAPSSGPRAYWLGESFRGARPAYASITTTRTESSYTVAYPGVAVEVDSSRFQMPTCGTTPVALADGTPGKLIVVPDGSLSCQGGSGVDVVTFVSTSGEPGGLAIVETSDGTIMLSGPAVSPKTAAAIARALRPV